MQLFKQAGGILDLALAASEDAKVPPTLRVYQATRCVLELRKAACLFPRSWE